MRVVIDTNVVISGIFWKGNPNKILRAWFLKEYGQIKILSPSQFCTEHSDFSFQETNQGNFSPK